MEFGYRVWRVGGALQPSCAGSEVAQSTSCYVCAAQTQTFSFKKGKLNKTRQCCTLKGNYNFACFFSASCMPYSRNKRKSRFTCWCFVSLDLGAFDETV